jgi:hypothetical protein
MTARQDRWRDDALPIEDVEARAKRLGITEERVLQEYARIGFSKITDVVEWNAEGVLNAKADPGDEAVAAIAEIVASASTQKIYRVKMHDKKPVLDAMARHLGLLPLKHASDDDQQMGDDEAREFLIRELDRAAAEIEKGSGGPESGDAAPEASGEPEIQLVSRRGTGSSETAAG